jgi:hypothetical protein
LDEAGSLTFGQDNGPITVLCNASSDSEFSRARWKISVQGQVAPLAGAGTSR